MTDTDPKPELKPDSQPTPSVPQDKVVETHHTLKIGEKTLDYTVTTGITRFEGRR